MPSLGTEKAGGGDPALQETLVSPHRPGTLLAYVEIKASLALFFFLGKNSNRKGMKTKSSEKAASDERHVPMGRDAVREGESGPGPIRAPRGWGPCHLGLWRPWGGAPGACCLLRAICAGIRAGNIRSRSPLHCT